MSFDPTTTPVPRQHEERQVNAVQRIPMPSEVLDATEEAATPDPLAQNEAPKSQFGTRIFLGVIGVIVLAMIGGAFLIFNTTINSAPGLADFPAYPGAGVVKMPANFADNINNQLKPAGQKVEMEMGLSRDNAARVSDFYVAKMKEKGYATGQIAPIQASQFFGPLRSLSGSKVTVFKKKDEEKQFYFLVLNTLDEKTAASANSEFAGLQAKPGDVLFMLAKSQSFNVKQ